ncbi:MAG TPA: DUF2442 domain-containing protein [Anaerolineae bacterium]|nr:DUF2442 domain-containing protein [Anaerolineae bacterium]HIP73399.1 DUF2442 domain-containing protein [Anaerolineae bacterium]
MDTLVTTKVTHIITTETNLIVSLSDGRVLFVPLDWYPRLKHGTPAERNNWELIGEGEGIHWPDLDEDISLDGLLAGRRSAESKQSIERWLNQRAQLKQQSIMAG